ncbi:hypothetical protein PSH85_16350 [Pseudomonas simiae]|uniref:hypothetical protein n=1 Tax=Pseudomonas simiae TaxID=321846 RepID=UPI0027370705|nr:hypothetical protein [Pseudomonas simiae]WLG31933.1 hypothetical protein PSH82_16320 [Pseudomonas simiae]WLI21939.1 hypothetical protein PSH85_16350 [Pseudomonas simiae]
MHLQPEDCCSAAMNEVDLDGGTDRFHNYGTEERSSFLVTGFKCKVCTQKWERFVEAQDPDEVRWDAVF